MFSVALLLLLLLAAGSCVKCEQLTQPASVTVQPGQCLTITCQVSYSVSSYATAWIRQPAGKGLEWIGIARVGYRTDYKDSLKNKFSIDLDSSSNTVTLNGQNVQSEDTAVYYCARQPQYYFDYWGKGTKVTVSSDTATAPTLFSLVQCQPGSGDRITVGCLALDFSPSSLTFQWTNARGTSLNSVEYPPVEKNNKYTEVSLVELSKSDWDAMHSFNCSAGSRSLMLQKPSYPPKVTLLSVPRGDTQALVCTIDYFAPKELTVKWKKNAHNVSGTTDWKQEQTGNKFSVVSILNVKNTDWDNRDVYTCEVTHAGTQYIKKASKAPITVTLNQPSPKEIFSNNQVKLECVITGQEQSIVDNTKIMWQIDGQDVAETQSRSGQFSKTSTMTRNYTEWQGVTKVRCSAEGNDMTPVVQDLTVHKGDGERPKVTVHVPQDNDLQEADSEITLVCLVTSSKLQDYYIAWSEHTGQEKGEYTDGINSPPQKTKTGYSVTSVYTITKEKWNTHKVGCHVWPAGSNVHMGPKEVFKAQGNSFEC
ncbi:immunoglobulin mu heavy chain-like [Sparus aurata]|uniref:immunoglobulin mu heavy chain-like n=1 Tax=Sparus aurata TaxID=8175 RepID=UPI0011C16E23|nr:immunoglobulin mu heavy chain-like [Sparus aurata]